MKVKFIAVILLAVFLAPLYSQDDRNKSLDFIILLDKSLSMDDKIQSVKLFFKREILGNQLKQGDSILLMGFYGQQTVIADMIIRNERDKAQFSAKLDEIQADGAYTDIGSAIDFTVNYVRSNPRPGSRQHFILLTDGIQESPPGSPYSGPKGFISHPFLENAKTLSRSGWKIQILGIGSETAANELAEELSASVQVWEEPQSMLEDTATGFFEHITVSGLPELAGNLENPELKLKLEGVNLPAPQPVTVKSVRFENGAEPEAELLIKETVLMVTGEGIQTFSLPLKAEALARYAGQAGELVFQFSGAASFTPGRVSFQVAEQNASESAASEADNGEAGTFPAALAFSLISFIILLAAIFVIKRIIRPSDKEDESVPKQS